MSGLAGARCVGMGELFESTDLSDHVEAASLCHVCPAITACRALLADERALRGQHRGHGGPVGTWAGELVGGKKYAQSTKFNAWLERRYGVTW